MLGCWSDEHPEIRSSRPLKRRTAITDSPEVVIDNETWQSALTGEKGMPVTVPEICTRLAYLPSVTLAKAGRHYHLEETTVTALDKPQSVFSPGHLRRLLCRISHTGMRRRCRCATLTPPLDYVYNWVDCYRHLRMSPIRTTLPTRVAVIGAGQRGLVSPDVHPKLMSDLCEVHPHASRGGYCHSRS